MVKQKITDLVCVVRRLKYVEQCIGPSDPPVFRGHRQVVLLSGSEHCPPKALKWTTLKDFAFETAVTYAK